MYSPSTENERQGNSDLPTTLSLSRPKPSELLLFFIIRALLSAAELDSPEKSNSLASDQLG